MRAKLTLTMIISMTIAVLIALTVIYKAQSASETNATMMNSREKLAALQGKLLSTDDEVERLKANVSENCLAKARAVADLLALDSSKKSDKAWLEKICKDLQVSEIHVIDAKGIITHSTVDAYIGFDMASGEQSGAFMKILDDPSYELAQEPQMNAAANVVVQYAGVARRDEKGFVQIGVEPKVLADAIAGKEISANLKEFDMGAQGFTFAINRETGLVDAAGNESFIGKSAKELGFPESYELNGKIKLAGVEYLGITTMYENSDGSYAVGLVTPYAIVRESSLASIWSVSLALIAINVLLLIAINLYTSKAIVNGIKRIGVNVEKITAGDYDVEFTENNNREFRQLSSGLNQMTASIRNSSTQMTEASEALSDATRSALSGMEEIQLAVKEIAENAGRQAADMDVAASNVTLIGDRITSTSQRAAELGARADAMQSDSNTARDAMQNLKEITDQVIATVSDVSVFASKTSESAQNIADAVGMIDSVAKQTKLLSFNASIEAARAGDAGKGFGVVAGEIQHLADQSAKASAQITVIIEGLMAESGQLVESMNQMEKIMGKQRMNLTNADTNVGKMVSAVDATMTGIKEIEQLTSEIDSAKDSLTEIIASLANIAQSNAASTEQTDAQLADAVDVFNGMQVYADKLKEVAGK